VTAHGWMTSGVLHWRLEARSQAGSGSPRVQAADRCDILTQPRCGSGWYVGLREPSPLVMKHNVLGLARSANLLDVPTILTTVGSEGMFGPLIHELVELFPDQEVIDRSLMDAWEDERVREAVANTGRREVIIAGLAMGVCATLPAISAIRDGYAAYIVVDASATSTRFRSRR
jgi:Isochorismatase family